MYEYVQICIITIQFVEQKQYKKMINMIKDWCILSTRMTKDGTLQ